MVYEGERKPHGGEWLMSPFQAQAEPGSDTLGILVVDDHQVFAQLIGVMLSNHADLECLGIAGSVDSALAMAQHLTPDLVLMDVQLRDGDGIAATAEMVRRDPGLRVVVLSAFIDRALMKRAAEAGACALLAKDGDLSEMLHVIRSARRGDFVVQPGLLRELVADRRVPHPRIMPLTTRELEVLRLLAAGLDAGVIARELGISLNTCRGYVKNLLTKLNAHSQLEAVVIAMRNGLIGLGDAEA